MTPKQCSLGNKVVIGYTASLKMQISDDNIFRCHGSNLFGFSLYFYLRKRPLNAVWCTADFQQLFERSSQDFPLISQDNSLVIMLCDRLCVWPVQSQLICSRSCKWDGWVRRTPWAQEGDHPFPGHELRRGKRRDFQRHWVWEVEESLYGAESSHLGDRENFLRTVVLNDLRSGHSLLQKVTDGKNKAWV